MARTAALALTLVVMAAPLTLGAPAERRDHHGNLMTADGQHVHTNALFLESSPYLRQHAHDPVDWMPWGEEAFARARAENKPIFLSIGYATCHWCHVMARESFSDEEVAAVLNGQFVPVKVDREERPDVDEVYMAAVQALSGRGGWPLSAWLTPELEPFDGGTYYRKDAFLGRLATLGDAWQSDPEAVRARARRLTRVVQERLSSSRAAMRLSEGVLERALPQLLRGQDAVHGGWGLPKFPRETAVLYLLRRWEREGDVRALAAARNALDGMARGGIHDQVGGGFARYATDARWLVPHFEKMLYNQAWLGRCYVEAWRLTGEPLYRRAAEGIFEYVARDMTAPHGAFYSAEDADSEGEEGLFYVWTPAEVDAALGPEEGALARAWFGIGKAGNFRDLPGRSIATAAQDVAAFAARHDLDAAKLPRRLAAWRESLTTARARRVRPERDEKIMADWNGYMIGTLARAGRVFDDATLIRRAETAMRHVLATLRDDEGGLLHVERGAAAGVPAFLDDHAALVDASIELADATGKTSWIQEAVALHAAMRQQFRDDSDGAFFRTGPKHETLLARAKDAFDGGVPSGNGLAAWATVRLFHRTGDPQLRADTEGVLSAFAPELARASGAASLLLALDALEYGEPGPVAHDGDGKVTVALPWGAPVPVTVGDELSLDVEVDIAEGWHLVNGPEAPEGLRPLAFTVAPPAELAGVTWPSVRGVRVAFLDEPLSLLRGRQRLPLRLAMAGPQATGPGVLHVGVEVQACDDGRCLRPRTLRIDLPVLVTAPPPQP